MNAIILRSAGNSAFTAEKPKPVIENPDEVLVRVQACGLCATDLKMYKGEYSGHLPVTPGHEFTGEVVEVGEKVTRFQIGDRVTADPNESCGASRL